MQTIIEKTCKKTNNYKEEIYFYDRARDGFSELLKGLKNEHKDIKLLLPAFIGYSPNEGSGIYDPVIENDIKHEFYELDNKLQIVISEFEEKLKNTQEKVVVLLVHYFGYIDKNIDKILKISNSYNAYIIEDCAHAFYTDYVDSKCGKFGNATIYSLHKMFPFESGGMLKINKPGENNIKGNAGSKAKYSSMLFEYDFKNISDKRKSNARIIEKNIKGIKGIELLRKCDSYKNNTPQTYPILIKEYDKNMFYHKLNATGYGVVSLYHTMIKPLENEKYNKANYTAQHILNLPVHQDVDEEQLISMCNEIKKLCKTEV